jgi:NAD(P)-dependent dehydrogenase (short-subunit alcohol dehydrogenase family)
MMERDEMNTRFSGKVVLVAGGTGGLGRAVSEAFLEEDAKVIVTYQNQEEFAALKDAVGTSRSLEGHPVDVTEESAVGQFIDRVIAKYDRVDAMVNTVGAYAGGMNLWELDMKTFDRMIGLNLRSGLLLSRAVIPAMLRMRRGVIVNVASKAAFEHTAGAAAYAASKAGAVAMMDSLAEELKGTGVRVNSILPSIIDTAANRKAMPGADSGKWPKPQDIARVILFLCSDDAKVIHGSALPVYGDT